MIGKTISHYKILEKLGEGGMGVVYKAEDTKLERTVALKFLSLASIGDEEKKRFKREAKAAASLNHPNIATIHAIDEADDQTFIAMEFVDGQSLQEIVGGKPMPIDKAIDYATQTAAGLQAAHKKGITHRDIKSANIMITEDGQVKIMDFGLAKLANRSKLTQLGTTLGTAAYMSPEQSRGETVDHRADIWSLGVVLYEMISGQMPFKGDYEQAVIYSIQNEEPEPLTALRSGVPIALDGIIAKALAKDAGIRYQNIEELPADLRGIETTTLSRSRVSTKQPVSAKHGQNAWQLKLPWIVATLMTLVASVALVRLMQTGSGASPEQSLVKRTNLVLPKEAPMELVGSAPFAAGQTALTFSPDGKQLVYVSKHNGSTRLFLRPLDRFEGSPLPGTDGAYYPFFSPDGKWVGFFAGSVMKKVAIDGGEPVEICEVTHPFGATWTSNDQIFFSNREFELAQVSAAGGTPVDRAKDAFNGQAIYWPSILPGNKHILVQKFPSSIEVLNLDNSKAKVLIKGGSNPRYLPSGHLVYVQPGRLMAVPFDLQRLAVTGSPVPIIDHVRTESLFRAAQYSVSDDGTLVYASGAAAENAEFVKIDKQGAVTETLPLPVGAYGTFSLSPNGQRLAYTLGGDILIHDITRNMNSRLTLRGNNRAPVWMPDGSQVVFRSEHVRQASLLMKSLDGREPESLATGDHAYEPTSVSQDGKHLICEYFALGTKGDIWLVPMTGKPEHFLKSEAAEWGPKFSPDGQYVAYTSDESGQFEVYVQPFPATGERWQLSTEGGMQPIWSPKYDELYYRSLGVTEMMVVAVKTKAGFARQRPKVLFEGNYLDIPGLSYDIYPDGEHFLMLKGTEEGTTRTQLNVVTNWFEEVKRKVPTDN